MQTGNALIFIFESQNLLAYLVEHTLTADLSNQTIIISMKRKPIAIATTTIQK